MSTEYEHPPSPPASPQPHRSDQPYSSLLDVEVSTVEETGNSESRARAPRISREDVLTAADALLVEGHRPTIDRVRMRLGRGSPNTINDHLDTWWRRLGSRLRDLPSREFPQLPERVSRTLQGLWNEALEAAHESLQGSLRQREEALLEREGDLETRRTQLDRDTAALLVRAAALDEALVLARAQLTEANQRVHTLEGHLQERDVALAQVRGQLDRVVQDQTDLSRRLEIEHASWAAERTRLQEWQEATETRWLGEVDRARQALNTNDRELHQLQLRIEQGLKEREGLRGQLSELKSELKTARAVREQLEARLHTALARHSGPIASGKPGKARSVKRRSTRRTNARAVAESAKAKSDVGGIDRT